MKTKNTELKATELTSDQSIRLAEMESKIEDGMKKFVDVGTALATIRNEKLYRATHKSFEQYCVERWGMKRAHASRMIKAAKVVKEVSPTGDIANERVAREIIKVPQQKRKAVVKVAMKRCKSAHRQMTGKDIQQAAEQLGVSVPPGKQAAAESEERNGAVVLNGAKSESSSSAGEEEAKGKVVAGQPDAAIALPQETMSSTVDQLHALWLQATASEREAFLTRINARLVKMRAESNKSAESKKDGQQLPLV